MRPAGVYEIAVRAINSEGPSETELALVTHVLQDLVPPNGLDVSYNLNKDGVLVATITWVNSMIFSEMTQIEATT